MVYSMTADFVQSDAGDAKRAFIDALYRKYSRALWKFLARQRLSRDEVADIVQETYCRILQAGNVDAIRNPKAFLFRVAHNVRLNKHKLRRSVGQEPLDIDGIDIASDEPGPYRSFKGEQELAVVRAAFEELAPKCREAFVMNRFENMTFAQIAAELDLSVSMIEKHVSHALSHMRKKVGEAHMRKRLNVERPALDREALRTLKPHDRAPK